MFLYWAISIPTRKATNPKRGKTNNAGLIGDIFSTYEGNISKNKIVINTPAEKLNNFGLCFFVNLTKPPLMK